MKGLYVTMVMAVMAASVVTATTTKPTTTTKPPTTTKPTTTTPWTTAQPGLNLHGKMFTLSRRSQGISFYPPYYMFPTSAPWSKNTPTPKRTTTTTTKPPTTTTKRTTTTTTKPPTTTTKRTTTTTTKPPPTTTKRTTTTTTRPPWTTAPSVGAGVSVCLRYLTDFLETDRPEIFTLSPSRTPLKLSARETGLYFLTFDRYGYNTLYFRPSINFRRVRNDIWNRVCVTLDFIKNVAQVFSGSKMSIRKLLPPQYVWSGEPVIEFSGFDGQVTDVQVWDYPLRSGEISNFMDGGVYYGPYSGSVLTWSSISYSSTGNTLFEDVYEQPREGRHQSKGEKKKTREFVVAGETRKRTRQQL